SELARSAPREFDGRYSVRAKTENIIRQIRVVRVGHAVKISICSLRHTPGLWTGKIIRLAGKGVLGGKRPVCRNFENCSAIKITSILARAVETAVISLHHTAYWKPWSSVPRKKLMKNLQLHFHSPEPARS